MRIRVESIALLILLVGGAVSAGFAQESPGGDPHITIFRDPGTVEQVIYSFKEKFPYALETDSTRYGTVEQFRALYPDSYWETQIQSLTNEDGTLAWLRTQDMLALAVLYDLTGDAWYLRWMGRMAEAAMAARDDFTGKKDEDGRTPIAWGSSGYGQGERRVYLVHSGLIINAILEYCVRGPKLPDWSDADAKARQTLIERCRETLLWHDYQLDPDSPEEETAYLGVREEGERKAAWQPFNRQILFARDFYLLYQITKDEQFLERSRKLYKFFRNRIERTPSDAYVWEYEPIRFSQGPVKVAKCDDISHATYSIEPVVHACRDEFVFDKADMVRLARTFTLYIHLGDGVFQSNIGCTPVFAPRYMDRFYGWLPLSEADPQIYRLIERFMVRNVEKPVPLAIAYLAAYRPKGMSGVDTRMR